NEDNVTAKISREFIAKKIDA
ncbi:TPA: preprotein translocase subunit YajC, partial [Campylobacter coli]|nr:preprotein translocase subunit YajC [Campylobacter coli]HED6149595.1 preprotein translocase subunit YajC [Campylobacter coli]